MPDDCRLSITGEAIILPLSLYAIITRQVYCGFLSVAVLPPDEYSMTDYSQYVKP